VEEGRQDQRWESQAAAREAAEEGRGGRRGDLGAALPDRAARQAVEEEEAAARAEEEVALCSSWW